VYIHISKEREKEMGGGGTQHERNRTRCTDGGWGHIERGGQRKRVCCVCGEARVMGRERKEFHRWQRDTVTRISNTQRTSSNLTFACSISMTVFCLQR
jgi:hypothetical protein